jgi:hypothetical protein
LTLDRPVLAIDSVFAFTYAKNHVMISVSLHCNAPLPFFIKEWNIKVPKLHLGNGADLNQGLFGHTVSKGEQILFTFDCSNNEGASNNGEGANDCDLEPMLDIVLQDEFGKTLEQVLPLGLGQFYEQIWKEEFTIEAHVNLELHFSAAEGLVGANPWLKDPM